MFGILLSMAIVFAAYYVQPVVVEYGASEIYVQPDMDAAIAVIRG